jgi:hypothetical protein
VNLLHQRGVSISEVMLMNIRFVLGAAVILPVAAICGEWVTKLVQGDGSDPDGQWKLTPQQIVYTENWIKGRSLNCLAGAGSPPAPVIHLHLVSSDGTQLALGLYSQPGYAKVVETRIGMNLCHYQASETDVAALREAVRRTK